ncbi:hypothetical protein ACFLXI_04895 [Chloroflexota bacterium]
MKRFLFVSILIVLIIFVVGTALTLYRQYNSLSTIMESTSCSPPCWQNIYPGETTTWEAVSILERTQNVGTITQWDERYGSKIGWDFRYPVRESSGYIYFADDTVMAISLLTYGSLSVTDALDLFGEPDYFWMRYKETFERHWLEVILAYPTQGIFVRFDIKLSDETDQSFSVRMEANNPVGRVIYFDPMLYENLLDSRILFTEDQQTIRTRQQPWHGLEVISYDYLVPD